MADIVSVIASLFQAIAFVVLYMILGIGPGFIVGVMTANWIWGRGNKIAMEEHQEAIAKAGEHNAQWNPEHPRWKQ